MPELARAWYNCGMSPARYDFKYYVGDTKDFVLYPKNSDGTPYDLSDYVTSMVIADELSMSPAWSAEAQASIVGQTIECSIQPNIGNQLISKSRYFYDVQISKTVGGKEYVFTFVKGVITPEIGVNKSNG